MEGRRKSLSLSSAYDTLLSPAVLGFGQKLIFIFEEKTRFLKAGTVELLEKMRMRVCCVADVRNGLRLLVAFISTSTSFSSCANRTTSPNIAVLF